MAIRTVITIRFVLVILFLLLLFSIAFFFPRRELSTSDTNNPHLFFHLFHPSEGRIFPLNRLVQWLRTTFNSRQQQQLGPNFPQIFQTDIVAGIQLAHHNPFSSQELKGVGLLFHGCRQFATDWFTLPEHRRITAELLRHHLAVLAISSSNNVTSCWSTHYPASQNLDASRVQLAVRQWTMSQGISQNAPVYAIGVSSGATFLSVIAAAQKFSSLSSQALYLSAGNPRALGNATETFPNTLFVRLQNDRYYAPAHVVSSACTTLLTRRVPLVADLPLPPEQWTADSIHNHEWQISREVSTAIFDQLPECQYEIECAVMAATTANPSVTDVWFQPNLRRAIVQIDRVLRGEHELTGSFANQVVDWLVFHSRHSNRVQ